MVENKIVSLESADVRFPSEAEICLAATNAAEKAGPELLKAFFNGYKDAVDVLSQAA